MLAPRRCYHCDEAIGPGVEIAVTLDGEARSMCCPGCGAAAEFIRDAGLDDFYRYRSSPSPRPPSRPGADFGAYDQPATRAGNANLLIEGLRCPACAWLVERAMETQEGVTSIQVNPATGRAQLRWREEVTPLSALLRAIDRLGYRPHVLGSQDTAALLLGERRTALKRLAVAGFGMMQVLTFAVAMYSGALDGMDPQLRQFLRAVSLLVATPVLFYAGRPFLQGGWNSLAARKLSIDLPVAIALLLAYFASVWNTLTRQGEIYFDSVTMFVFLLLLGRFVEMTARHQAGSTSDALLRLQPREAQRVRGNGYERVVISDLRVGDRTLVATGEAFPGDGEIEGAATTVNESLLTGESLPVIKAAGASVVGGSINAGPTTTLRLTAVGADTALSAIVRLLEHAQSERPRLARIADRWAGWFLARVLGAALVVALIWLWVDPTRAFEITLSVLVVTCPCALSLATPAAFAAATAGLARRGVLVSRADAIEALAGADHALLDKTGTLTVGTPAISRITALDGPDGSEAIKIAAALEQGSGHPLALAFRDIGATGHIVDGLEETAGCGISGTLGGKHYRLGRRDYVATISGPRELSDSALYLGSTGCWELAIELRDPLRPEAASFVADLESLGINTEIASGDSAAVVEAAASALGISQWQARLSPLQKLERCRILNQSGARVLAIGDGINDAPVLQAAQVSIALGSGAALAQDSADIVLPGSRLGAIPVAIRHARRTMSVTRQNLVWATTYNLAALPAAALGYVPPWLAAIGMSLSSLVVIFNAARLRRLP